MSGSLPLDPAAYPHIWAPFVDALKKHLAHTHTHTHTHKTLTSMSLFAVQAEVLKLEQEFEEELLKLQADNAALRAQFEAAKSSKEALSDFLSKAGVEDDTEV